MHHIDGTGIAHRQKICVEIITKQTEIS